MRAKICAGWCGARSFPPPSNPPACRDRSSRAGCPTLAANFLQLLVKNRRPLRAARHHRRLPQAVRRSSGRVDRGRDLGGRAQQDADGRAESDAEGQDRQEHHADREESTPPFSAALVVKIGSRMVDSSIRTKLNNLKYAMKEVG